MHADCWAMQVRVDGQFNVGNAVGDDRCLRPFIPAARNKRHVKGLDSDWASGSASETAL